MTPLKLIILGIVIGSNNFAVALTLGAMGQIAYRYRVMTVFGVFEFVVPLIGICLGRAVAEVAGLHSNAIGAVILLGLGFLAVTGGIKSSRYDDRIARLTVCWSGLTLLAAGLSIDNLMVGFSLGLGKVQPLLLAGTISFFSVVFTWLGMRLGSESRRRWEQMAKIATGSLLMLLGVATGLGWL
ncbi:MAG: manganese efflux pump [Desulfonatronovibrio sp.]